MRTGTTNGKLPVRLGFSLHGLILIFTCICFSTALYAQSTYYSRVSGDWSTASTWSTAGCGGSAAAVSPSATDHVVICAGNTVTLSQNVSITDLTIDYTGLLDATTDNYDIALTGDWLNSGDAIAPGFSARSGEVAFNGTTLQLIQGSTEFYDLDIDNSGGVNIASDPQDLVGTLTLTNGTFNTNDAFVLKSESSSTARIGEITGGSITGDVTVERYVQTGDNSWRFFSAPASGVTLADWDDDFATSGFPGSDDPGFGWISIYTYDESVLGESSNGYTGPTDVSDPINVGEGYWVYLGPLPLTFEVTGPANTGNITIPVTYTDDATQPPSQDGWNMVGNPYPSSIDWDSPNWTKTNIGSTIYIYKEDGSYATYPFGGPGTNGGTKDIGGSQGFWVQAIGSNPVLTATEGVKSSTDVSFLKTSGPIPYIKLAVSDNGYVDEAIVRFYMGASDSLDSYDGYKLQNTNGQIPNISTGVGTEDLTINSMSDNLSTFNIPVKALFQTTGSYTINISKSHLNLPSGSYFILEDLITGTITDLFVDSNYTFTVTSLANTPRFMLRFGPSCSQEITDASCNGVNNGSVVAWALGVGPWDYTWVNYNGDTLQTAYNSTTADTLQGLAAGAYGVHIADLGGYYSDIINAFTVAEPLPLGAGVVSSEPSCYGDSNGSIHLVSSGGNGIYTYIWANGDSNDFISGLSAGSYQTTILDQKGCQLSIVVELEQPDELVLTSLGTEVSCNGEEDGAIDLAIAGGTAPYYHAWSNGEASEDLEYLSPGTYSVITTDLNNCWSTSEVEISEPEKVESEFTVLSNSIQLSDGGLAEFVNTSKGADAYFWDFADGSYSTAENPSHTYTEVGYYQVSLTASKGICQSESNKPLEVNDNLTGINNSDKSNNSISVKRYNDGIRIEFEFDFNEEVIVSIYTLKGDYLIRNDHHTIAYEKVDYTMLNLPPGMYFVSVVYANKVNVSKVMVVGDGS